MVHMAAMIDTHNCNLVEGAPLDDNGCPFAPQTSARYIQPINNMVFDTMICQNEFMCMDIAKTFGVMTPQNIIKINNGTPMKMIKKAIHEVRTENHNGKTPLLDYMIDPVDIVDSSEVAALGHMCTGAENGTCQPEMKLQTITPSKLSQLQCDHKKGHHKNNLLALLKVVEHDNALEPGYWQIKNEFWEKIKMAFLGMSKESVEKLAPEVMVALSNESDPIGRASNRQEDQN